jgi:hypothetical protein
MMMGPEPMSRIFLRSLRRGMSGEASDGVTIGEFGPDGLGIVHAMNVARPSKVARGVRRAILYWLTAAASWATINP